VPFAKYMYLNSLIPTDFHESLTESCFRTDRGGTSFRKKQNRCWVQELL